MTSLGNSAQVITATHRVIQAATAWWLGHRPEGWNDDQHRRNPAVNCSADRELELAYAASDLYDLVIFDDD